MTNAGLDAAGRSARRLRAQMQARSSGGVLSRRQLLALGIDRWEITAELRAQRWQRLGRQTMRICEGDPASARWARAVHEVGSPAVLDGISALVAAGLRNISEAEVHVAVPKSANPRRCGGVVVHETRRYEAASVVAEPVPRMAAATAAVHAALWAATERQAALFVITAVQQGLCSVEELAQEAAKVRRDRRRSLLRFLIADIAGGVESLGEREFARMCEQRVIPRPARQVCRRTETGHWRMDNVWDLYRVTAEIDGAHHRDPASWIPDALKQNEESLGGHLVLRIPNIALRVDPEPFFVQLRSALRRGGWTPVRPKGSEL